MALGNLLGLVGSGIAKAVTNYANEKKKNTTTPTNTTQPQTKTTQPSTTPSYNEHQSYINQTHPGGYDAYTKLQNDRYSQAIQSNDVDLLKRLQADSQRVGYNLSNTNAVPQFDMQPYLDKIAGLENQLGSYQSQLQNFEMPDFSNYNKNIQSSQNDIAALLNTLENYQGADSMSMDESMARAYSQLNGIYNANLDKTLDNYNKNAISRGMFGQLPVEALKANAISETELNKANATNQLAGNMFAQDFSMARQKDADFYNKIGQQAGLVNNSYNIESSQYQNAVNEYLNSLNLANMKDQSYYDDVYRQLDLINSQYGATQDQFNNAYKTFSANNDIQSKNKNQQYEQAMNKFNLGYVDQSVADILGIPLGKLQEIINSSMSSNASSGGGSGGSGGGNAIPQEVMESYPEITFPQKISLWNEAIQKAQLGKPSTTDMFGNIIEYQPTEDEVYREYLKLAKIFKSNPFELQADDEMLNELLNSAAMNSSKQSQDDARRNLNEKRVNQ